MSSSNNTAKQTIATHYETHDTRGTKPQRQQTQDQNRMENGNIAPNTPNQTSGKVNSTATKGSSVPSQPTKTAYQTATYTTSANLVKNYQTACAVNY